MSMTRSNDIRKQLPGFNCGACGLSNCDQFAHQLASQNTTLQQCPVLLQERFAKQKEALHQLLNTSLDTEIKVPKGLIDHARADFLLHPLAGEVSCRETLVSFAPVQWKQNMLIRYRPLGCPITHFARIIKLSQGLLDVWVVGPCKLLNCNEEPIDVGICMVLSFQGTIEGRLPKVGQTVKFLPAHCMMGKVHSGIIVQLENESTRIDCIDLKIWEHASVD